MLSEHVGEDAYPGDFQTCENWPGVQPGVLGGINALSPKYAGDVSKIWKTTPKPPVLWIRGTDDQIVSDMSLFDFGTLGKMGIIPGWPGDDVYPPQPMISQTRAVLDKYAENGGTFTEVVFEECAHSPHIEKPEQFNRLLHEHLAKAG
jgi:pimeloyl-ACP methyl ester carboxylesterase